MRPVLRTEVAAGASPHEARPRLAVAASEKVEQQHADEQVEHCLAEPAEGRKDDAQHAQEVTASLG